MASTGQAGRQRAQPMHRSSSIHATCAGFGDAERGIERPRRTIEQCGERTHRRVAPGRAAVDVRLAAGDGGRVGPATGIQALAALRLRQQRIDALDERVGVGFDARGGPAERDAERDGERRSDQQCDDDRAGIHRAPSPAKPMKASAIRPAVTSAIGRAAEGCRHVRRIESLAQRREQQQCESEAGAGARAEDERLEQSVLAIDVQQRHAEHGAVGRDQRQEDAEQLVQQRARRPHHDLGELHHARDQQDEDQRAQVLEAERHQHPLPQRRSSGPRRS